MEVAKVSAEAQEAQKDGQEQLYREAALKSRSTTFRKSLTICIPRTSQM